MRRVERSQPARCVAHLLFVLAFFESSGASAQARAPVDLVWNAPQGCESADDVHARVRELIGEHTPTGAPLRAEATITSRAGGTLLLKLTVRAGELVGERIIEGKSCADLAGSAAIALALLLRAEEPVAEERAPSSAAPAQEPKGTGGLTAVPSGAPPAVDASSPRENAGDTARARPASEARRHRAIVRAPVGVLGFGPLRRLSFGLELAVGASLGRYRLEAEGRLWLPREVTAVQQAESYGARVERYTAGVRSCRTLFGSTLELAPCLSLAVEHIAARGTGPHISGREAKATWVAAGIGLRARLQVARWLGLVGGLDLQLQTARPTILIEDVGKIAKLLPISATVSFGPEWIP